MPGILETALRAEKIKREKTMAIRTIEAEKGVGMGESTARRFLVESRLVAKLGTVDGTGEPYVHPVWYLFESEISKLYVFVEKNSKKHRNIMGQHRVYFDVDDSRWPYKGVRGKGNARVVTGKKKTVALIGRILTKYVKKRDHPIVSGHLEGARKGVYVVIEITPMYFSTWDYGKIPPKYRVNALK